MHGPRATNLSPAPPPVLELPEGIARHGHHLQLKNDLSQFKIDIFPLMRTVLDIFSVFA